MFSGRLEKGKRTELDFHFDWLFIRIAKYFQNQHSAWIIRQDFKTSPKLFPKNPKKKKEKIIRIQWKSPKLFSESSELNEKAPNHSRISIESNDRSQKQLKHATLTRDLGNLLRRELGGESASGVRVTIYQSVLRCLLAIPKQATRKRKNQFRRWEKIKIKKERETRDGRVRFPEEPNGPAENGSEGSKVVGFGLLVDGSLSVNDVDGGGRGRGISSITRGMMSHNCRTEDEQRQYQVRRWRASSQHSASKPPRPALFYNVRET